MKSSFTLIIQLTVFKSMIVMKKMMKTKISLSSFQMSLMHVTLGELEMKASTTTNETIIL